MKRKRANAPRQDPEEEAKVVAVLAGLAMIGPLVVLSLRPLFAGDGPLWPLPTWEKVLLLGATPLFALMSLALFFRSSGARRLPVGRVGATLAAVCLALAVASAWAVLTR